MAIKSMHWVFINEGNDSEKIVVHDRKSAEILTEVLKAHEQVWVMKEEYSSPVAANQPQAQATAQPVQAQAPAPQAKAQEPVPPMPEMHVEGNQPPAPQQKTAQAKGSKIPAQTEISEIISAPGFKQSAQPAKPVQTQNPQVQNSAPPAAPPTTAVLQAPAAKAPPPITAKAAIKDDERRTQKRFAVDLRIILISRDRSFRSISKDVSLGGMKLKNRVPPEFSGQKCIAYISNLESKENIEMVCQVIADPNDPCRIQFSEPDSKQLKRLNEWLIENSPAKKAG